MTKILQLKINLEGITPKIWRRFLVKDSITFQELHNTIQAVMGWDDYHLFEFQINGTSISADEEGHNLAESSFSLKSKINTLINLEKQKFTYVYDFGDDWEHAIVVEKVLDSADSPFVPYCIEGERACPPEDCGSVPGYYELIRIKKNKRHPEYDERIVDWLGEDFDFEQFDLNEINKGLRALVKIDGRARYWALK